MQCEDALKKIEARLCHRHHIIAFCNYAMSNVFCIRHRTAFATAGWLAQRRKGAKAARAQRRQGPYDFTTTRPENYINERQQNETNAKQTAHIHDITALNANISDIRKVGGTALNDESQVNSTSTARRLIDLKAQGRGDGRDQQAT